MSEMQLTLQIKQSRRSKDRRGNVSILQPIVQKADVGFDLADSREQASHDVVWPFCDEGAVGTQPIQDPCLRWVRPGQGTSGQAHSRAAKRHSAAWAVHFGVTSRRHPRGIPGQSTCAVRRPKPLSSESLSFSATMEGSDRTPNHPGGFVGCQFIEMHPRTLIRLNDVLQAVCSLLNVRTGFFRYFRVEL